MLSKTLRMYDEIVKKENAIIVEGMKNPIKIIKNKMIMYCIGGKKVYECLLDSNVLPKLLYQGAWVAHTRRGRDEIYFRTGKHTSLHRFLTSCPKGKVVDHENRNSLDNRITNLRVTNQGINMLNKGMYKNHLSEFEVSSISMSKGYIQVRTNRRFYDINLAKEAAAKLNELMNYYSVLDAQKRIQPPLD